MNRPGKPPACRVAIDQKGRVNPENSAVAFAIQLHGTVGLLHAAGKVGERTCILDAIQRLDTELTIAKKKIYAEFA